ncbi:Hypothetical protein Cp226_1309 [Corynebacterium pseudotuberculosis]|nr:Hypothetical protein Cp226_1309 [Corynebacterium pseudotuberculosis]
MMIHTIMFTSKEKDTSGLIRSADEPEVSPTPRAFSYFCQKLP